MLGAQQLDPSFVPEVERFSFEPGYPTSRGTVDLLVKLAREFHAHPRIVARARSLVAHLPSMDIWSEVAAVWDFILSHVRYVRDPLMAEWITVPAARRGSRGLGLDEQVDLGIAQEDCESIALYGAALLGALGIPSEFEIQGRRPDKPWRFTHCALLVKHPRTGEALSFDPIGFYEYGEGFGLGDSLHVPGQPLQRFSAFSGEQTLLGYCFGDAASDLEAAKQYGTPLAQALTALGPAGLIIGGGFQAGTAIAGTQIKPSQPQPQSTITSSSTSPSRAANIDRFLRGGQKLTVPPARAGNTAQAGSLAPWLAGAAVLGVGLLLGGG